MGSWYISCFLFQEKEIRQRFIDRRQHARGQCDKYKKFDSKIRLSCRRKSTGFNLKHVNGSNLVYCAIEKTGSTFWKKILHVAGGWGNDSNPTSIRSEDADIENGGFNTLINSTLKEMVDKVKKSSSIMFVRDPYTRLFSAWLDKFYAPNHYYWSNLGPLIFKSERPNMPKVPECAHDITFPEFINFILKELKRNPCMDGHFSPNYDHCFPCRMSYDYIGKYESLKDDTLHILDSLNLSTLVTFGHFEKDAIWDAIKDNAEFVFSTRENLKKCGVPFRCVLFKVWNRMQSRGILSANIPFPYRTNEDVKNITKDEFATALLQANHASNPKEIKNNRKEALTQAYQSISLRAVSEIIQGYEVDFDMFEYEKYPEFVQILNTTSTHEYFRQCPE